MKKKLDPLATRGYRFCVLPSGNYGEFPGFDEEMRQRGVDCWYVEELGEEPRGRIFRVPLCDLKKLPYDRSLRARYLGDDDSGHKIYPLNKAYLSMMQKYYGKPLHWRSVYDEWYEL